MQAALLLALVSGASAFLKAEIKSQAAVSKLSSWEQMQEDALARAGAGLPKTIIRVASASMSSSFLEQVSDAAQVVTIKAPECMQCVEEHFEEHVAAKIQALSGEQYAEACTFCGLYAFGGVYAGQDAQVYPKAWNSLPTDKISVIKDESVLASPPRKAFWKDAVSKIVEGTWSLPKAIDEAGSELNVLECDAALSGDKCTVAEKTSHAAPMILMEVETSKKTLNAKYDKVHNGIKSLMGTQEELMAKIQMDMIAESNTGNKIKLAIDKEAFEAMKMLSDQVVEQEESLKQQVDAKEASNPAVLLQTQKIEMNLEEDMPVIKQSVADAIAFVQSGQEKDQGEAVLTAARKLLLPVANIAQVRQVGGYQMAQTSVEKLSKMDEVARKVILGLSEADTVRSVSQAAAMQSLEEAATKLYKQQVSKDDDIAPQTTEVVQQLAKLLPQKKTEEKKVLLKAKDTTMRTGAEADNQAMKALEGALGASKPSLVQEGASQQDMSKMDKHMSELTNEMELLTKQEEELSESASLEADLAELSGQDKLGEEW